MQSLLYSLNVGTLATWLSISGASTVACVIKVTDHLPEATQPSLVLDSFGEGEFDVSETAAGAADQNEVNENPEDTPTEEVTEVVPEMPELAQVEPLPEIPELPAPEPEPLPEVPDGEVKPKAQPRPQTTVRATNDRPRAPRPAVRAASRATQGGAGGGGTGNGSTAGKGSGISGAARVAGGRIGKPAYPRELRDRGVQGVVKVTFTLDASGNVLNAYVVSSPDPKFNADCLATVRKARFPPGSPETLTVPFRFKL